MYFFTIQDHSVPWMLNAHYHRRKDHRITKDRPVKARKQQMKSGAAEKIEEEMKKVQKLKGEA